MTVYIVVSFSLVKCEAKQKVILSDIRLLLVLRRKRLSQQNFPLV